jgi:diphosphomevalonate decarboxylase
MINTKFFIPRGLQYDKVKSFTQRWTSPSNIALVKYWGKTGNQIPANPSLSFTLKNAISDTEVKFTRKKEEDDSINFKLVFEGKENEVFHSKIHKFFNNIVSYAPYLKKFDMEISSSNSFPHSSGIASSASGFSAIAMCLIGLEKELGSDLSESRLLKKASFLARLGSGSAARSIQGPVMVWGEHECYKYSQNEFAILPDLKINDVFTDFQDTILLVDKGAKEVSSTQGHALMNGHLFADARFKQAELNMIKMAQVLRDGNLDEFGKIVESEALTLHAMMMTSSPSYILMKPRTLSIIQKVKEFRKESGLHLYFTLDAGANVHLLYPKVDKEKILSFIKSELIQYCEGQSFIEDEVGVGAVDMSIS